MNCSGPNYIALRFQRHSLPDGFLRESNVTQEEPYDGGTLWLIVGLLLCRRSPRLRPQQKVGSRPIIQLKLVVAPTCRHASALPPKSIGRAPVDPYYRPSMAGPTKIPMPVNPMYRQAEPNGPRSST